MEILIASIEESVRLNNVEKKIIYSYFDIIQQSKNELLLKEHQYSKYLYFIKKGTVRTYYEHKEKYITSWFYKEGQWVTSWYSFLRQEASYEAIETLEDCELYMISYSNYQKLILELPKFERFARLLIEDQLTFIDYYSKGYMFLSAKERYDLLLQFYPDIELRVKLGLIASFLGISQETLSRLRKR